jgi:hypothetical protein
MSKEMSVILLGAWLIIVPYLGIPSPWKTFLVLVTGIVLMVVGFLLRGESLGKRSQSKQYPFVESNASSHDQEGITSLN